MSVKGGDEVTLSYEKDPSGDSGADCVWLKNFKLEELHSLTFDTASDAQIYLTDSEGKTVSPSEDGVYVVSDGSYSYTITKFGYETASGTVTVDGQNLTQKSSLSNCRNMMCSLIRHCLMVQKAEIANIS